MLAEVRADRVHDGEDSLDVAYDDEWVLISGLSDEVVLLDTEEVVEEDNDAFDLHVGIELMGVVEGFLDLVVHKLVPQTVLALVVGGEVESLSGDISLDPLLQDEELEDGSVGYLLIEVRIVESVTSICKRDSTGITTELLDTLLEGHEVTRRLGHLLSVQAQVAIAEVAASHAPGIVLPDGLVLVEGHRQMVPDEILARYAHIHGIPVVELIAHFFKCFCLNARRLTTRLSAGTYIYIC